MTSRTTPVYATGGNHDQGEWSAPTQYEWRLTYDIGDGRRGVVREGFGLDEKGARAAHDRYLSNPDITELKLWRRPKPAKWEEHGV